MLHVAAKTRKTHGAMRALMNKTPLKEGRETRNHVHGDRLDARSDMSETPMHAYKLENTFKMEPDNEKRFKHKKVEDMMRATLFEFLDGVEYDKTLGSRMSKLLSDTIKTKAKEFRWTRYKLVVQVVIGQKQEQDLRIGSRFLWNDETDCYACANYSNKSLFALAVCYGVYLD